jgi:hypothetical protein
MLAGYCEINCVRLNNNRVNIFSKQLERTIDRNAAGSTFSQNS